MSIEQTAMFEQSACRVESGRKSRVTIFEVCPVHSLTGGPVRKPKAYSIRSGSGTGNMRWGLSEARRLCGTGECQSAVSVLQTDVCTIGSTPGGGGRARHGTYLDHTSISLSQSHRRTSSKAYRIRSESGTVNIYWLVS